MEAITKKAGADGEGTPSCEKMPEPDAPPLSKKQKKQIRLQVVRSLTKVADLFTPYLHLIKAKRGDEEDQVKAAQAFSKWANGNDPADLEALCQEGFALEEKLQEAANKQRAFESKGEDQVRFVNAADYADNWVSNEAGDQFNVYYICRCDQGAGWGNCNTLIQSKEWDTLHEDPMAVKQRWYCRNCGGKYKTRYGVLIEWKLQGVAHYLLAELPPPHLWDVKGMIIEARFGENCGTPEELFKLIPTMAPASTNYFQPRTGLGWKTGMTLEGHFEILNMDHLQMLPKFPWDQFYHFPEIVQHGVDGAVQRSREAGGVLQSVAPAYIPYVANTCTLQDVWM